jgi:hypothetical protein
MVQPIWKLPVFALSLLTLVAPVASVSRLPTVSVKPSIVLVIESGSMCVTALSTYS